MDENRYSEWLNASYNLIQIEMLLLAEVQALGELDVELIKEFPKIKINSTLKKDKLKKRRYMLLSKLWVLGAYEFVRLIDGMIFINKNLIGKNAKTKLKENLTLFTRIRIPLTKLERPGKEKKMYSQIAEPIFDLSKGIGWRILSTHKKDNLEAGIFYRKDLGDSLLDLLKHLKK